MKRLFAFVISMAMLLGLSGCGLLNRESTAASRETEAASSAESVPPTAETEAPEQERILVRVDEARVAFIRERCAAYLAAHPELAESYAIEVISTREGEQTAAYEIGAAGADIFEFSHERLAYLVERGNLSALSGEMHRQTEQNTLAIALEAVDYKGTLYAYPLAVNGGDLLLYYDGSLFAETEKEESSAAPEESDESTEAESGESEGAGDESEASEAEAEESETAETPEESTEPVSGDETADSSETADDTETADSSETAGETEESTEAEPEDKPVRFLLADFLDVLEQNGRILAFTAEEGLLPQMLFHSFGCRYAAPGQSEGACDYQSAAGMKALEALLTLTSSSAFRSSGQFLMTDTLEVLGGLIGGPADYQEAAHCFGEKLQLLPLSALQPAEDVPFCGGLSVSLLGVSTAMLSEKALVCHELAAWLCAGENQTAAFLALESYPTDLGARADAALAKNAFTAAALSQQETAYLTPAVSAGYEARMRQFLKTAMQEELAKAPRWEKQQALDELVAWLMADAE